MNLTIISLFLNVIGAMLLALFPPVVKRFASDGAPVVDWIANPTLKGLLYARWQRTLSVGGLLLLALGLIIQLVDVAATQRLAAARGNSDSDWMALKKQPISLSTDVVFKTDIALPDVKEISGTAKFLPQNNPPNSRQLGYLVHVVVPPLDLKKVPEKYLKDKPTEVEGVKAVQLPIKQVYYEVGLTFTLKDKDGFTVAELASPSETVISGKDNQLQNFASKPVTNDIAARTKAIYVELNLKKCLTCEDE